MKSYTLLFVLFIISISSIATAQEITMKSSLLGTQFYEDGKATKSKYVCNLMKQNTYTRKQWNKGVRNNIISKILMGSQAVYLMRKIIPIANTVISTQRRSNNGPLVIGNILFAAFSGILYLSSKSAKRSAIDIYNNNETKDESHIHLGSSRNGIGLVYSF